MKKSYLYKGIRVFYDLEGEGEVLVFLHGYLESRRIWNGFSDCFLGDYRVLRLDIPGHGESEVFSANHSMDELAIVLKEILDSEQIGEVCIFGHSMGGYLTMAFAALFPEMLRGFCLFHSTCFADSDEKKANRDKEIDFIRRGKRNLIVNSNISNAFSDDNLLKFSTEIDVAKEIGRGNTDLGIISLLEGMKGRKDYSEVLKHAGSRAFLVWGEKDNYISKEVFSLMLEVAPDARVLKLKKSGHMGFIEERENSYNEVISFLNSLKKKRRIK